MVTRQPSPEGLLAPTRRVVVNGFEVEAAVDRHLLEDVLVPRLEAVARGLERGRRAFVFLAAPPGTGKSTLAALLAEHAHHLDLDTVGLDGFHHPQAYLEAHHLAPVKGAPETFDLDALARYLDAGSTRDLAWPVYDRLRHDVVPEAHRVRAGLVVVEGNWLLLDEPGWSDLTAYSAYNVFIHADPDLLRERLVERKVHGGLSRAEAMAFYDRTDRVNVERVLAHTDLDKVDLLLHLTRDGTITQGEAQ